MESTLHVPNTETASIWTDEKHLHFLNAMEASFVRTMLLHRYPLSTHNHNHNLPLDRHLPDTSESTLDAKPNRTANKHAPSDSRGARARPGSRRTRRKSSQREQAMAKLENGREGAACVEGGDHKEQRSNV